MNIGPVTTLFLSAAAVIGLTEGADRLAPDPVPMVEVLSVEIGGHRYVLMTEATPVDAVILD